MAETSIFNSDLKKSPIESLFQRRIEFHTARKPFSPYSSNGGDFHLETLNPTSSDLQRLGSTVGGPSSVATGKQSDGGGDFLDHGLDPELSFGITVRRIGAGLANLGNTCFLNSVLQCLTYTEPFAAYLQSGKHKSSCQTAGFCALCAIQNHVRIALQSTGKILSPSHLVKNLRCISRNFRSSRQEDAHEYMVNLLESMHRCCLPSGVSCESPTAYEKSLVHRIFGGHLRSQVKCMQCSYCSNKFDPFLDLSLEIVKADSLSKALAHFTALEQLDGGEKQYQCQRCKEKVKALKQLTVHKAPYVLTIHLKRFGSDVPGQKINKKVDFRPKLDLKPFVSDTHEGDLKYTLYGVLVHAGWSTHSGHYYCFVRTSSGMWYSLDDNQVVQVSERTVLEQKAYMLFYVRDRRTSALKKPMDAIHKEKMTANTTQNKELPVPDASCSKQTIQNSEIEKILASRCSKSMIKTNALISSSQLVSAVVTASEVHVLKEVHTSVVAEGLQQSAAPKEPELDPSSSNSVSKEPAFKDTSSKDSSVLRKAAMNGPLTKDAKNTNLGDDIVATEHSKIDPRSLQHSSGCTADGSSKNVQVALQSDRDRSKEQFLTGILGRENNMPENHGPLNERVLHDMPCRPMEENDLKLEETKSVKLSSQSDSANTSLQKVTFDTAQTKLKPKKHRKFPAVRSLQFGPRRLFIASLRLRKKKHKSKRRRSLDTRMLIQKSLTDDSISNDQGPSTSGKAMMNKLGSIHGQDQKCQPISRKGNSWGVAKDVIDCNGSSSNVKERDLNERSGPNGVVLSTNELLEKNSSSMVKQCVATKMDDQAKRGSVQHGLISMLTRGLKEVTVACWDDIELPTLGVNEKNDDRNGNGDIGYVLDEWDEEYDRGKRKKVRKSRSFGGPNPFQEIATKQAQIKKMKTMDRTSAGNRPYRI